MATAPNNDLPLFYKELVPLSSIDHADFHARPLDSAAFLVDQHAVPLTSDEFVSACRHYPIVFSAGDNPVPLALMGLNEGVNTFFDDEGKLIDQVYVPAYIRRYPFILAKLTPETDVGVEGLALAAGAADFIRKPVNPEVLLSRVGIRCRERRRPPSRGPPPQRLSEPGVRASLC